jgi:multidrug resistance efflux pump
MTALARRGILVVGLLAAAALALATTGFWWPWRNAKALTVSGTIEAHEILVGSKVGGRVAKVHVREGDRVKPGQVLVELERDELEARKAEAAAAVAQAQATLDQLQTGSRPEEIARARRAAEAARQAFEAVKTWPRPEEQAQARADLKAAEAELGYSEAQYRRFEDLFRDGAVSAAEVDNTKSRRDADRAKVASLRERLRILETGSRAEDIAAAEARFKEADETRKLVERGPREEEIRQARANFQAARARLEVIETQLAEMVVTSPADAVVEVFDVRPGNLVTASKPLATLIEPDLWVRVYVPESQIGLVRLGQDVRVRVDSFPGRDFRGAVEQINRKAEFTPRNVQTPEERVNQVLGVKVRLDNREGLLRAGMAADVFLPLGFASP